MGLLLKLINSKLFSVSEDDFLGEVFEEPGTVQQNTVWPTIDLNTVV